MKQILLYSTLLCLWSGMASAQSNCPNGEQELLIEILTDPYGYETAWSLQGADGTLYDSRPFYAYDNNTLYQETVCVPDSTCISFFIEDSYGDGIFAPGYYLLVLDGDTLTQGRNFGYNETFSFGCAPGQDCNTAIPVGEGFHSAPFEDTWYSFQPDSVGTYAISTCGLNTCNTKIWVYDTCEGINVTEDNTGTIFYNDEGADCAPQAVVEAFLSPDFVYIIRIGDNQGDCTDSIGWELSYLGPVVGCTDPTACNFQPLASVDDGSCLPQGDPDCPAAPDLSIRQDVLETSIYLTTINSTDPCLISEGCLHGYGLRDIARFTTWIDNIGELDYYIGQPAADNNQFTWDNCHNHFHYDAYAEYILFTEAGEELPIGFKNGFCVLDLGCDTGSAQYGCANMGISKGCYDYYDAGLECQWIDLTDVPDGRYTFVTRVNWGNAPDKLGRIERDTLNNWGQVCILLDRSSGSLQMQLDPDCPTYVDCTGELYGDTPIDCEGVCGGSSLRGDLDLNGAQEMPDVFEYITGILGGLDATACNDLNADGRISVYDASLLASCLLYGEAHQHEGTGAHDHCRFPAGVFNASDTTLLSIIGTDFEAGYVDIGLYNPSARINAYQFEMSGLQIMSVESLTDANLSPMTTYGAGQTVIGISYQDSTVQRSSSIQPLCRIHYSAITDEFICIAEVVDIVNRNQEQTLSYLLDPCVAAPLVSTNEAEGHWAFRLMPNPTSGQATLFFENAAQESLRLEIMDLQGRVLELREGITGREALIDTRAWPEGMYVYRLSSQSRSGSGRMLVQR